MFVRHVRHKVVTERIASADFILVGRIVRNMDFSRRILRELAKHNAVCTDFIEHVAFDQVVVRTGDHVETIGGHLRKGAVADSHMVSIFNTETSVRTPEKELVTAKTTVFSNHFDVEHTGLQIEEALLTRAQIVRMSESQAFESHVTDFALGVFAKDAKERVDTRCDDICRTHVFAFTSLVIQSVGRFIQVPFPRLVDEFVCIFEVIDLLFRRIAHECGAKHRVLAAEKFASFRILRFELESISLTRNLVKTQDAFGPSNHQMDFDFLGILPIGRFDIAAIQEESRTRRIDFVQTEEVVIAIVLEIRHTGTNRLLVVHVKLAETGIDTFGFPDVVLFVVNGPTTHRNAARNKRSFAVSSLVTDIETVFAAIGFSKAHGRRELVRTVAENHFDIARHGAVNSAHGFLGLRNSLEGSIFCSLVRITTIWSNIESRLNSSVCNGCAHKKRRNCGKLTKHLEAHTKPHLMTIYSTP